MSSTRTRSPPDHSLSASRRRSSLSGRRSPEGRSRSPRRSRSPVSSRSTDVEPTNRASKSIRDRPRPEDEAAPPLPDEAPPPLPDEAPPPLHSDAPPLPDEPAPGTTSSTNPQKASAQSQTQDDDGWEPHWDPSAQAFYFYNRFTQATQWENPRIPDTIEPAPGTAPGTVTNSQSYDANGTDAQLSILPAAAGGYNPRIHGSYDPNASYAQPLHSTDGSDPSDAQSSQPAPDTSGYTAQASFNTRTGAFSNLAAHPTHTPTAHTDEAKSKRQMSAFFDVDAAANRHDGRSLKEERRGRKLTKEEVKAFREKARGKREEKKRRWLRD